MIHLPTGQADFRQLRQNSQLLYVDKTYFIKDWWESSYEKVTLICRPRFFGKTVNLTMVDYFFSNQYENLTYLFHTLYISEHPAMMELQGQIPVIFLQFSDITGNDSASIKRQIKLKIWQVYIVFKKTMLKSEYLDFTEKKFIESIDHKIDDELAIHSIEALCGFLFKVYQGKMSIVILDEYDSIFTKNLKLNEDIENFEEIKEFYFNFIQSTFKNNKFLVRGLISGVTNIPLFSDFNGANNINVYTTVTNKYSNCFGFLNDELFKLAEIFQMPEKVDQIMKIYGGYYFGGNGHLKVYNPWSIIQFLNAPSQFSNFWFSTSTNDFFKEALKDGLSIIKDKFVRLMQGKSIITKLSNNVLFADYFDKSEETIWKILYSTGYLTIEKVENENVDELKSSKMTVHLIVPNIELRMSFEEFINGWFQQNGFDIDEFLQLFVSEKIDEMEFFLSNVIEQSYSIFNGSQNHPEMILHAFVLFLTIHIKSTFSVKIYRYDEFFYVFLKATVIGEKSIILMFSNFTPQKSENISKWADQVLNNFDNTKVARRLERKGVDLTDVKKFSIVYNGSEIKISFKNISIVSSSEKVENEEEEEVKEEVKEEVESESENDDATFNSEIVLRPKFDHKNKNKLKKNDLIYVIDNNGVDIWEAVLKNKAKNNIYEIHYPDFPQDDERIKGLHRILTRSKINKKIYTKQEVIRNNILNENKKNEEEEKNEIVENAKNEEEDVKENEKVDKKEVEN